MTITINAIKKVASAEMIIFCNFQQHLIFAHFGLLEYVSMLQSPKRTNLEHC